MYAWRTSSLYLLAYLLSELKNIKNIKVQYIYVIHSYRTKRFPLPFLFSLYSLFFCFSSPLPLKVITLYLIREKLREKKKNEKNRVQISKDTHLHMPDS